MATTTKTLDSGIKVQRTEIIGGGVTYSAWAPSSLTGNHGTISTIDGAWYGRLGTERLPADLEALPAMTEQRSTAVRAWQNTRYEAAYEAILEAFPGAFGGRRTMGSIDA